MFDVVFEDEKLKSKGPIKTEIKKKCYTVTGNKNHLLLLQYVCINLMKDILPYTENITAS